MINTTYHMPRFGIGKRKDPQPIVVGDPVIQENTGMLDRFRHRDLRRQDAPGAPVGPGGQSVRPIIIHGNTGNNKRRNLGILATLACTGAMVAGGVNAKEAHDSTAKDIDRQMVAIAGVTPKVDEAGDKFVEKLDLPKDLKPIVEMSGLTEYGEGAGPIMFLTGQLYLYEQATEQYFNKQARENPQPVEVQGVRIETQNVEQANGYDVPESVAVVSTETVVGPVDTKAWTQGLQGTQTKLVDDKSQPIYSNPDDFDKGIAGEIADMVPEQICVGGSWGIPKVCGPDNLGPSDDPVLLGYKQMSVTEDRVESVKTAADLYSRLTVTDKDKLNQLMEKTFTAESPDYEATYQQTMDILKPYYVHGDEATTSDSLTRTYPFVHDFAKDLEHQNKWQTYWFLLMMAGAAGAIGINHKRIRKAAAGIKDRLSKPGDTAAAPVVISGALMPPSTRVDGDNTSREQ